ncbi:50S ribosomal protein L32 [Tissierella creatinini]|nr:50S ribosomal protein L32 [Tissierella creatinini]TJX69182.1 50S ribosomal protein L32 [Soehngenia saccharolytica]
MAVPKRKTSKQRKNKRRASSYRLNKATVVECPQCHETKQPHRVCPNCGYYKNREVIVVE